MIKQGVYGWDQSLLLFLPHPTIPYPPALYSPHHAFYLSLWGDSSVWRVEMDDSGRYGRRYEARVARMAEVHWQTSPNSNILPAGLRSSLWSAVLLRGYVLNFWRWPTTIWYQRLLTYWKCSSDGAGFGCKLVAVMSRVCHIQMCGHKLSRSRCVLIWTMTFS